MLFEREIDKIRLCVAEVMQPYQCTKFFFLEKGCADYEKHSHCHFFLLFQHLWKLVVEDVNLLKHLKVLDY